MRSLGTVHFGPVIASKRVFPRLPARIPVRFRVGAEVEEGVTVDVSLRGMRIRAPRAPEAGEAVEVELSLPSGEATRVEGRVVFVEPVESSRREGPLEFAVELTRLHKVYASYLSLLVSAAVRRGGYQ